MITMIAAIQRDSGIGCRNGLLWDIPEDKKRFRDITVGGAVIMGRLTFESIPLRFRPLQERLNIVLTRDESWKHDGVEVVHSLADALACGGRHGTDIHIIGGAQVYAEALLHADILHLTVIDGHKPADAFFPPYERLFHKKVLDEPHEHEGVRYRFVDFVK